MPAPSTGLWQRLWQATDAAACDGMASLPPGPAAPLPRRSATARVVSWDARTVHSAQAGAAGAPAAAKGDSNPTDASRNLHQSRDPAVTTKACVGTESRFVLPDPWLPRVAWQPRGSRISVKVGWPRDLSPGAPADPDMQISRIRLFVREVC